MDKKAVCIKGTTIHFFAGGTRKCESLQAARDFIARKGYTLMVSSTINAQGSYNPGNARAWIKDADLPAWIPRFYVWAPS